MDRRTRLFIALVWLVAFAVQPALAQNAETATLRAVHADNLKHLSLPQITTLSGLSIGAAVGKSDLQAAADRLVQTGLFSNVNYSFQSKEDGLYLTLKLAEAPRIP